MPEAGAVEERVFPRTKITKVREYFLTKSGERSFWTKHELWWSRFLHEAGESRGIRFCKKLKQ